MNEIELIKRLDSAAGPIPEVDVADNVMRRIRSETAPVPVSRPPVSRPMWGAALLSGLAAVVVAAIAIQSFAGLQDPLGDLFTPVWTTFQ